MPKGVYVRTSAHRAQLCEQMRAMNSHPMSIEARAKMSASCIGRKRSDATRAQISEAHLNLIRSEARVAQLRAQIGAINDRSMSDATRAKHVANNAGIRNPNWRGGEERRCAECGRSMWVKPSRPRQFCGRACRKRAYQTEDHRIRRMLNSRMTRLMNYELGRSKAGRRWQELAGYSTDELKARLESLFVPGMSWANRTSWHIDHIRPRALFQFVSAEDPAFKACWALDNLQPLWAVDNMKKGARPLHLVA